MAVLFNTHCGYQDAMEMPSTFRRNLLLNIEEQAKSIKSEQDSLNKNTKK